MFLDLLFAPILAPITGMNWIAGKILEQAEPQLNENQNLKKQLLSLQLAFDMGDLPEAEFEEQEEILLLAIQAMEDEAQADLAQSKADQAEAEQAEADQAQAEQDELLTLF